MAYFRCTTGGSGKGNTLVVTCADDLAGATITCTNGTKTYRKTCPSTAPYEVTFYGLEAGTWTVSAAVSGTTYIITAVITDYEAELGGFNWKTWVDLSENYTSSDFTDLDELLDTELAVRELMTIHACVDYLAGITAESADVETIIGNDLCAKWINNRDYALDTLYANTIIADYMDEADKYFYGEWIITDNTTTPPTWGAKGNVPVMTSNTAPYGTAHATSELSGYPAYKAFDKVIGATYISGSQDFWVTNTSDGIIWFDFPNPVCAKQVKCQTNTTSNENITSTIVASNDKGTTYKEFDTFVDTTTSINDIITANVGNNDNEYYTSWGIKIGTRYHYGFWALQFYGRELSVSVPVMSGNTTPYGEAFSSSNDGSNLAWKAFDTDNSNGAVSAASPVTFDVGYDFGKLVKVKQVYLSNRNNSTVSAIKDYVIQGYDGENWVDVVPSTITNPNTQNLTTKTDIADTYGAYTKYRIHATSGYATYFIIGTLQFYGLDYSEKEFEEGTTKKWLYDHGVELEALEAVVNPYTTGSVVTKKADGIYCENNSSTSSAPSVGVISTNAIDLTDYSVFRAIDENMYEPGSTSLNISVLPSKPTSSSAVTALATSARYGGGAYGVNDIPYAWGLDISNINQAGYLQNVQGNVAGNHFTLKELWLE